MPTPACARRVFNAGLLLRQGGGRLVVHYEAERMAALPEAASLDFLVRARDPEFMAYRFIRGVFTRLLNGLREVHSHKLLHLDLKPSNVYLRSDNTPLLIEFGAARQTLSTDQPMLKPMYTPGFASPEHYGTRKDLGPWSDIYSVGASMYACIAGSAPQAANDRYKKDTLVPAMIRWEGEYSDRLLEIIDWCLNLNHFYRPQSVFALQKALVETVTPPTPKESPNWLNRFVDKYKKASR